MNWILTLLCVVCLKVRGLDSVTKASRHLGEYLHVTISEELTPIYHERSGFTVSYKCQASHQVAVWLTVDMDTNNNKTVFYTCWSCDPNPGVQDRYLVFRLPKYLAYRPDHLNPNFKLADKSVLIAAITKHEILKQVPNKYSTVSQKMVVSMTAHNINIPAPYERPVYPRTKCFDWFTELMYQRPFLPYCPVEPEVYKAVVFPVALSGAHYGVYRSLPEYSNPVLEAQRRDDVHFPKFTYSLWLYVVEYCPHGAPLCSIVHRVTWDDVYVSPLIMINPKGLLHLQLATQDPVSSQAAYLTPFSIVKNQWCHIVAAYSDHVWEITMQYGPGWSESKYSKVYVKKSFAVYLNDASHLTIFGGSEVMPSFKGYIGKATVYRSKKLKPSDMSPPSPYHPMFELELSERGGRCANYLNWVQHKIINSRLALKQSLKKDTCPDVLSSFVSTIVQPQCSTYDGKRYRSYKPVAKWIRKQVFYNQNYSLPAIGDHLYSNTSHMLEELGLKHVPSAVPMLKQASCYGNLDATYMLSVVLNYGLVVKVHEIKAHSYMLDCAMDGSRLCQLAMANKHLHGIDGIPVDPEQAYVYFKAVADKTRIDKEAHNKNDIMTEHVRLTDDRSLMRQTDADGDLFNWVKHQAQLGVTSAQKEMARMLHWGTQGIMRNLREAAEYYRLGAQGDDPVANYDYGIVLLRGQGVEKNETKALKHLTKAAKKGHVQALNALGWHALEIEKNGTKGVQYFKQAYKKGNPDAAHNLGHIYYSGAYKGQPADRLGAFEYFSYAAKKGQIDSSVMIAKLNMRGHPKVERSVRLALWWSRFVAEKNPALGWVLAKGLKAYRHQDWETALLYYLMAASTGVEVANFNLAYLCEQNVEGLTTLIEKECTWRHYNLSTQGSNQHVDPYAWIKMGDYHWYGCVAERNALRAAQMYAHAAAARDPHAIFNLAFLVEEGVAIPKQIWKQINLKQSALHSNVTILTELYTRCKESPRTEAYLPCSLALVRLQLLDAWARYNILVKLSSILGTATVTAVTLSTLYSYIRSHRVNINTV